MRRKRGIILSIALLALIMPACYLTRESDRPRDDYFQPVAALPQRGNSTLSTAEIDQLRSQLESATIAAMMLRDSLIALQKNSGALLISMRSLTDKISELEAKEYLSDTKQKNFERNIADLQTENKNLSQQLSELQKKLIAGKELPGTSDYLPARVSSSLQNEYNGGLVLFHKRQYNEARTTFEILIERGIEEDLLDNCTYWMGECSFAKREYHEAISKFQRVIAMESSNKRADSYFMLARSYEQIGDLIKARWAYEELNAHYPNNEHAKAVKIRLDKLKQILTLPSPNIGKKNKSTI